MSLPESLERAATQLPHLANQIRPANGDPHQLLEGLAPAQAGEALVWVLANEADSAQELVDAWGEWEKGAEVLLAISDEALAEQSVSKAGRKVLRKAHHRLRSRGIEVATTAPSVPSAKRPAAVEDPFEAAHLSTPDFRGARVGYLADRHPSGGARLFEIRFDEGRGILDFKVYNAGRSKVRGFLRSLSTAEAQRLFDVPRTALCALVRRASLAQPADRPLPAGFMEWRGRIFPESLEKESTPGGLVRAEVEKTGVVPDVESSLDEVAASIAAGAIGPWPPAPSWLSERMEAGRVQAEGLESDALEAAIVAWCESTAKELAAADDRGLLARHLEELAWVRKQSEGLGAAASLIVAADAVVSGEVSGDDSGDDSGDATEDVSDDSAQFRLARARVESLFAPFLGELRAGGEQSPEDEAGEAG